MKSNTFLFLSLAAFFSAGFLLGAGSQYVKAPIAPDNFNQVLTRSSVHPDMTWTYFDTVSNRPVIGFIPHP